MHNIGRVTITTPGDRQIVVTRLFDAPRTVVFEAWTKAEHVTHWWDPSGAPLAVCEIDLRPNGAFRWVNRAPDGGEGHSFTGKYREIAPPGKLVFTGESGFCQLVFTEEGQKTKLTMTIECATREDRDALLEMRVDAGTAQTLENLAAYLPKIARAGYHVEGASLRGAEQETKQEDR